MTCLIITNRHFHFISPAQVTYKNPVDSTKQSKKMLKVSYFDILA